MTACNGGGSGHSEAPTGFADTVYSPEEAAFCVLSRGDELLVVPDTARSRAYAAPLYIGRGEAPSGAYAIPEEPRRIVCMSSTHVAMLSALGLADRVVGVSGLRFITDPEIQRLKPADVGRDENVDYELLLSLRPDLVLLYGIGAPSPMEEKLRQLRVPFVYLNEFMEQSPLGKAEWLVALAEICGKGDEGRRIYQGIAKRYRNLRDSVAVTSYRPGVMLNTPYQGSWFMPAGDSYMIRLVEDAGGTYVYPNSNSGSVPVDIEEAYRLASGADVWINVDAASTLGDLRRILPKFADIPPVQNGRVWASNKRNTAGGGNDFYESGIIYPDRVLSDLHLIFSGGNPDSTYYYKRIE